MRHSDIPRGDATQPRLDGQGRRCQTLLFVKATKVQHVVRRSTAAYNVTVSSAHLRRASTHDAHCESDRFGAVWRFLHRNVFCLIETLFMSMAARVLNRCASFAEHTLSAASRRPCGRTKLNMSLTVAVARTQRSYDLGRDAARRSVRRVRKREAAPHTKAARC
jgi:hypothetical protein